MASLGSANLFWLDTKYADKYDTDTTSLNAMSDTDSCNDTSSDSSAKSSDSDHSENNDHRASTEADAGEPRRYVPPKGVFTEAQKTCIRSFAERWNELRITEQDARVEARASLLTLIVKELEALPEPPHAENLPLVRGCSRVSLWQLI